MNKPTEACATPVIDHIRRLIRDLNAGAIIGYDGPQEYWSTRLGAEASAEVARLLTAALAVKAGATATELDVSLALYELITLAKGDGIRSVTDPAYTDRLFTEEQAYRLILSALTPASSAVEGEAVAEPFMYGIMCPDGTAYMDEVCVDTTPSGTLDEVIEDMGLEGHLVVPLYAHPAPTPAGEWRLVPVELPDDVLEAVEDDMAERRSYSQQVYAADVWDKILEALPASPAPHQEGRADG